MKRIKIVALMMGVVTIAFMTAACHRGAGSSPTATFTAFYEASKNKDVEAAKKIFSKKTLELFEIEARAKNKTIEEMFKAGMDQKPPPDKLPEMRNEKINGDEATLEVKDDKTGRWDTLTFVKEDGQWKIALDKMGSQSPDAK